MLPYPPWSCCGGLPSNCAGMEVDVSCPSCGEPVSLWIDSDGGTRQRYIEDCAVCCRPMQVVVALDEDGEASVQVMSLDA
jgi:hypothetical protein